MFWKIIFVLYSLCLFVFGFISIGDDDYSNLIDCTNIETLVTAVAIVFAYLLFNVLYGLARKIRTQFLTITKSTIILILLMNAIFALINIKNLSSQLSSISHHIAAFELIFIFFAAILSPLYVPAISYLKTSMRFSKELKHKFFHTFALFWAVTFVTPLFLYELYSLVKEPLSGELWQDIISIICNAFITICFIGYITGKNFLPRKVLQIACIPALLISFVGFSFSEFQDVINEMVGYPVSLNLIVLSLYILEILIIYRYCFKDVTKDFPDYIEVEPEKEAGEKPVNKFVQEFKQKNRVSKVAYILLAFLFGTFGVHKFCAGKPRIGFLYLLLGWSFIPSILSLADIIIACFQKADNYGKIEI